jgi:hypothetical protein
MINTPLHSRFLAVLFPYLEHWDDWVISDYCFFNAQEIEIVNLFQNNPDIGMLAHHYNKTEQTMRFKIKRTIRKLHSGKATFAEWIKKYKAGTDQQDYPLHVPVTCLPVSTRLKTSIYQVGDTLHEIFLVTQGDLKKYRRFGSGNQLELETFLQGCGIDYNNLVQTVYLRNYTELQEGNTDQQQSIRFTVQEHGSAWPGGKVCRVASGC